MSPSSFHRATGELAMVACDIRRSVGASLRVDRWMRQTLLAQQRLARPAAVAPGWARRSLAGGASVIWVDAGESGPCGLRTRGTDQNRGATITRQRFESNSSPPSSSGWLPWEFLVVRTGGLLAVSGGRGDASVLRRAILPCSPDSPVSCGVPSAVVVGAVAGVVGGRCRLWDRSRGRCGSGGRRRLRSGRACEVAWVVGGAATGRAQSAVTRASELGRCSTSRATRCHWRSCSPRRPGLLCRGRARRRWRP